MKVKYSFPILILLLFSVGCQTNNDNSKLNLSFESIKNEMPKDWYTLHYQPNYLVSLDSVNVKSGKYAIAISSMGDSVNFQALAFDLPSNYDGEKITLSGYIKTKNVIDGYAGLWMRIDPEIAFDNMSLNGVTGTTDWKKYQIMLDMNPTLTQKIVFGGLLVGKGEMWLDDLAVTIDGKDIEKIRLYDPKLLPAKKDSAFDSGSNIIFPKLDEQKINDLELLGRIWGFLKYHHPAVATGNYNWDYELFRILPVYLKANDNRQRDQILSKWINKYGKIAACKESRVTSDSAFLKSDLSWIEKSNINFKLKDLLRKIYLNRYQGSQYYVRTAASIGNPLFLNENSYSQMRFPDVGFRLLALYRSWNMIYYFFPYKYLTDKEWSSVLKEYIPYFIETKTELEYELIATRIVVEVCDTHAGLWEGGNKIDSLRGDKQAPVRLQFIEKKWVVTDYFMDSNLSNAEKAKETGLKIGDVITHVGGKPIESIVDSIKKYYSGSNEAVRLRNITDDLLRSNQHMLSINYISSGQLKKKEIYLKNRDYIYYYKYKKDTTKCYKFINKDIGYVSLKSIKDKDINEIKKEFKNTKGIIIDIRNYPSHFVPFLLGSYFILNNTPFVKFTNGNTANPGEFNFIPSIEISKSREPYLGQLIVIVNEETQSQAEYTAMAFRAGANTIIIGSQTAGADGNVSDIVLPGGLRTTISGIGVYYPDGGETQRVGIIPDIEVRPTIRGIREDRDELLEKAIEIIKNKN